MRDILERAAGKERSRSLSRGLVVIRANGPSLGATGSIKENPRSQEPRESSLSKELTQVCLRDLFSLV